MRLLIPVSDPMAHSSRALSLAAEAGHAECVALLLPVSEQWERAGAMAREGGFSSVEAMIKAFIEAQELSTISKRAPPRLSANKSL